MAEVCSCTEPGFCERRGCVLTGLHFRKCQAGHVEMLDKLYRDRLPPVILTTENRPDGVRGIPTGGIVGQVRSQGAASRELVGRALRNKIEKLINIKAGSGCECKTLADQMDTWGIAGCEQRRGEIVQHLVGNSEMLIEALGGWSGFITGFMPDSVLRVGAEWLLDSAIEDARQQHIEKPPRVVSPKLTSMSEMKLSAKQQQLRDAAQSSPPPEPDPFTDTPVIHFSAHLWPIRGNWEWHAERWNEIASGINGRCIVGVVTDATTATLDEVRQLLSDRFELFEEPNTKQGENPTFRKIHTMIPQGQNDVLLYCHGKGVREHTRILESVRLWTEMMYEAVLHNADRVVEQMGKGYKCFGAFRSFGEMPLSPTNHWHYSGTFFAVRAKHIGTKNVKTGYGGVEAWPGDHFPASDAWCEFFDAPGFKFGYDLAAMYPKIVDAQMQWEVDRIGGPRCEQHKRELDWSIGKLQPIIDFADYEERYLRCLVIGSRNGGLEYQLQNEGIVCTAIDIAPQPDNAVARMIVGSSTDPDVQRKARDAGPYDVVFIDGDHSYAGAKADWEFAQTLHPELIAFHDIAEAIKHRNEGCHVDTLWNEIKATHRTEEKIVGCGWGGIGIVWRDRDAHSSI